MKFIVLTNFWNGRPELINAGDIVHGAVLLSYEENEPCGTELWLSRERKGGAVRVKESPEEIRKIIEGGK